MAKHNKNKQEGLWIPNSILNLPDLDDSCRMLLTHFYSLGTKGCCCQTDGEQVIK